MKSSKIQNYFRVLAILTLGKLLLPVVFENIFFPLSAKYFYLLAWVVSIIVFYPRIYIDSKLKHFYFFVLLYYIIISQQTYSFDFIWYFQKYLESLFFAVILLQYFIVSRDYKGLNIVLKFSVLFMAITLITSIIGLQQFPMAARNMSAPDMISDDLSDMYRSIGINGYGFFYGIAFMLPIFVLNIKQNKHFVKGLMIWISISLLSLWGLVEAKFTAAFLVALLGGGVVYWAKFSSNRIFWQLSLILLFFILIPDSVFSDILRLTAMLVGEGVLQERLVDLGTTLEVGVGIADTHFGARAARMPILINNFLKNPIFGGGSNLYHNYWLDTLSQFGLIGIIPWIMFLRINIIKNSKLMNFQSKNVYWVVMLLFVVMGLIKGMGQHELFMFIFFIIPAYLISLSVNIKKMNKVHQT